MRAFQCFVVCALAASWLLAAMARPAIRFSDVTEDAGIRGIPQHGGHGAQVADVNGDGHLDLHVTNIWTLDKPFSDELYLGKGDGTFENASEASGLAGNGKGTHGAVLADVDADGDLDAFKGRTWERRNALWLGDGSGKFTQVTDHGLVDAPVSEQIGTRGVIAADFDADGDLDLFGLSNEGNPNQLYINDGTGHFTEEAGERGLADPRELGRQYSGLGQGCVAADYDGDGDVDIYTCIRGMPNRLWQNDGTGHFANAAEEAGVAAVGAGDGAAFGDIDNDGDLDLLADAGGGGKLLVFRNRGDGTFEQETEQQGIAGGSYAPALGDVDNDGDLDLYVPRDYQPNSLYLNDGTGRFTEATNCGAENNNRDARCAIFADLDEDGDLDLVVVCKRDWNVLLRNDSATGNWLKVSVRGSGRMKECFGAKVYVYEAGHLDQPEHLIGFQEVRSATGYCGQVPPVLHFGLGEDERADVRVRFPDGREAAKRGERATATVGFRWRR